MRLRASIAYCTLRHMMQLSRARIWVQALPRWSAEDQEAFAVEWCEERQIKPVVYRAGEASFEAFVTAVRETEAAVLADLVAIVPPPKQRKGERPGTLFSVSLGRLLKRSAAVIECRSDAVSTDDTLWLPAHKAAMRRVTSGRKSLPRKQARGMQERAVQVRASRSPLAKWRGEKDRNTPAFRRTVAIWRSLEFGNAADAQMALPEELHSVSRRSLERLFGGRT